MDREQSAMKRESLTGRSGQYEISRDRAVGAEDFSDRTVQSDSDLTVRSVGPES